MAKQIPHRPARRGKRPPKRGVSRRPQADRWSLDEIVNDLRARAQEQTRATRALIKGHMVYLPVGAVIVSRRVTATRYHRSASGMQKILKQMAAEGSCKLEIGKCGRLCHGKRHEHVSVLVFHEFAGATPCSNVITRVITRAIQNVSAHRETEPSETMDHSQINLVVQFLRGLGLRETPYDWSAAQRLLGREAKLEAVKPGLVRIRSSRFLRGKVPGWRLGTRFTGLTAAWACDHFEDLAAGRYDDRLRGKFAAPPPVVTRLVRLRDGRILTPALADDLQVRAELGWFVRAA